MFKNVSTRVKALALTVYTSAVCAAPAFATPPAVADIWDALDISGIAALMIPVAILVVGIALVGIALAVVIKLGKKVKSAV